jgi:hypothetical protein
VRIAAPITRNHFSPAAFPSIAINLRRRFSNADSSCMSAGKLKHKHATELKALEKEQVRFGRRSQQSQGGGR